jgi:hypothetical protein
VIQSRCTCASTSLLIAEPNWRTHEANQQWENKAQWLWPPWFIPGLWVRSARSRLLPAFV